MSLPPGMALEQYISTQFKGLSLDVPDDDVEMMARFVEEEGLEREEKVEGVRGMLEGVVQELEPSDELDAALNAIVDEYDLLAAESESEEQESSPSPPPDHRAILASLTEEELKAARKAAIIRQYAYVEGGPEEVPGSDRPEGAPPRASSKEESEEKKKAEERRRLVEEALALDARKKKYRKARTVEDPLEWQNVNKEKVQLQSQMQREAAKRDSQGRRERDRLALEKQRADQAKAKADRQKKAQKQERRG